jgi:maleate cis-trans isomerase
MSLSGEGIVMYGWRARIGVLVPPGNPTVEPEFYQMAPEGVTIHFARLQGFQAANPPGAAAGMEARTLAYLDELPGPAMALSSVGPGVVILAHTASSYAMGFAHEPQLIDRLTSLTGTPVITAAGAILAALQYLGVKRLALGTPYPETISARGRAFWEAAGFDIVGYQRLVGVQNIYRETEERAYQLACQANTPDAEAVLLSGTGMPTVRVLDTLEQDLKKPVLSSNQAALWRALRLAGVQQAITGFGSLLRAM